MGNMQYRKVKRGVAKNYKLDAKHYDYYYIIVNNKSHTLEWNHFDGVEVIGSREGQYVVIDGDRYYLDWN